MTEPTDIEFKEYCLKFRSVEELVRKTTILQRAAAMMRKNLLRYLHDNQLKFKEMGSRFIIDVGQKGLDIEELSAMMEENNVENIINALNEGKLYNA